MIKKFEEFVGESFGTENGTAHYRVREGFGDDFRVYGISKDCELVAQCDNDPEKVDSMIDDQAFMEEAETEGNVWSLYSFENYFNGMENSGGAISLDMYIRFMPKRVWGMRQ